MARSSKPATQRQKDRGPQERALPFGSQQRQTLSSQTPVNLGATPSYQPIASDGFQPTDPSSFRRDVHSVSPADLRATGPGAGTMYDIPGGRGIARAAGHGAMSAVPSVVRGDPDGDDD